MDHDAFAEAEWKAGVARLRRAFAAAGIRRVPETAFAALALAATVWREVLQTPEHFRGVVLKGLEHAPQSVKRRIFLKKLPVFTVDAELVKTMRVLAGRMGRLEALMLVTIATEELWRLCGIKPEDLKCAIESALSFAHSAVLATAFAASKGTVPTSGGQA